MALERINPELLNWLNESTKASLKEQGKSTDFVEALENAPINRSGSDCMVSRKEINKRFSQSFFKQSDG